MLYAYCHKIHPILGIIVITQTNAATVMMISIVHNNMFTVNQTIQNNTGRPHWPARDHLFLNNRFLSCVFYC